MVKQTLPASSKAEVKDNETRVKVTEVAGEKLRKPRSTPASGRWWKPVQHQKASMGRLGHTKSRRKALQKSWNRKLEERRRRKEIKQMEEDLREMKRKEIEEEKEKRLEKQKRKAEAQFKNARLQVVKNSAKIKKMNKKQLRRLKKTVVDKDGNVRIVGAYA
mmetsp:Transcript_6495/g.7428  ORF Transcript_6495/g.7428 Transcript_6495/m.7428 type:complete len:162 (+) Transcript_6495:176-661(+)|eukprot:CAMPEP_0184029030 /NCGR_PEP_ID=MMETSP0954-20121128/15193_1 /TAXON_ID=627963 /ORGANISM="Aplanochytrium sp, Strain PBS07" /LENGTH=161 /DNA_ID=CAMNT_0026313987 /DNA_START=112 /DNA_END=597 /DNA_ORIENTATION=-